MHLRILPTPCASERRGAEGRPRSRARSMEEGRNEELMQLQAAVRKLRPSGIIYGGLLRALACAGCLTLDILQPLPAFEGQVHWSPTLYPYLGHYSQAWQRCRLLLLRAWGPSFKARTSWRPLLTPCKLTLELAGGSWLTRSGSGSSRRFYALSMVHPSGYSLD